MTNSGRQLPPAACGRQAPLSLTARAQSKLAPPPEFQPVYNRLNEFVKEVGHPRKATSHLAAAGSLWNEMRSQRSGLPAPDSLWQQLRHACVPGLERPGHTLKGQLVCQCSSTCPIPRAPVHLPPPPRAQVRALHPQRPHDLSVRGGAVVGAHISRHSSLQHSDKARRSSESAEAAQQGQAAAAQGSLSPPRAGRSPSGPEGEAGRHAHFAD